MILMDIKATSYTQTSELAGKQIKIIISYLKSHLKKVPLEWPFEIFMASYLWTFTKMLNCNEWKNTIGYVLSFPFLLQFSCYLIVSGCNDAVCKQLTLLQFCIEIYWWQKSYSFVIKEAEIFRFAFAIEGNKNLLWILVSNFQKEMEKWFDRSVGLNT